ncbi:hypothetical protein IE53DRAFT_377453, partial [Violaceomyces palustris]
MASEKDQEQDPISVSDSFSSDDGSTSTELKLGSNFHTRNDSGYHHANPSICTPSSPDPVQVDDEELKSFTGIALLSSPRSPCSSFRGYLHSSDLADEVFEPTRAKSDSGPLCLTAQSPEILNSSKAGGGPDFGRSSGLFPEARKKGPDPLHPQRARNDPISSSSANAISSSPGPDAQLSSGSATFSHDSKSCHPTTMDRMKMPVVVPHFTNQKKGTANLCGEVHHEKDPANISEKKVQTDFSGNEEILQHLEIQNALLQSENAKLR